jgi:thiopeptide-type bacteriocin biosynthesis protein
VHEWLDDGVVSEFFFMHKPPGIRVRLAPAPGRSQQVRAEFGRYTRKWAGEGLITAAQPAVYEPEAHLFGGPAAMPHVHRLFTVDSMTWLAFHALPREAPAWALSLLMLREIFGGLGITGWEQRDVWARVAGTGRRQQPGGTLIDTGTAGSGLRTLWDNTEQLAAMLPADVRQLADRHANRVRPLLHRWRTEYFDSEHASLGPRQAAAYYVVFHWNRAALSLGRQILITESLAGAGDVC